MILEATGEVGVTSASTTATVSGSQFYRADKRCLAIVTILMPPGITVTDLTGVKNLAGTYTRLLRHDNGSNDAYEVWVGYDLPDGSTGGSVYLTATFSASNSRRQMRVSIVRCAGPQRTPPTLVQSVINGGASGAVDIGAVTPGAVGDIVLWAFLHIVTSAPTYGTEEPAATAPARKFAHYGHQGANSSGVVRWEAHFFRQALDSGDLVPHRKVVTAGGAWVNALVCLRPHFEENVGDPVHVYKGRATAVLDTVGAA